ncbi:MAG: Zn-dependent alcohol dehydrogenase [Actinomycetota bacterium]
MQASVLRAVPGLASLGDVEIDTPQPFEVLVRVVACGLCHSDLHIMNGTLLGAVSAPAVLGHEVAGVVERIGSAVTEFSVGDHVVGCTSRYCGHCPQCLEGHTYLCVNRKLVSRDVPRLTLDGEAVAQAGGLGGFAEYILVGQDALVRVPDEVPLDRAALLGCAVITGAGSVMNGAKVTAGSSVVVFGCGGIGLNVIQAASISGAAQVIAVDMSAEKLELATVFGATDIVDISDGEVVPRILALTRDGVDYAFDCVGRAETVTDAVRVLRPAGTVYMIGVPGPEVRLALPAAEMIFQSKSVRGLLMGANNFKRDIPLLADLYLRGILKLDELVGERIGLSDVNAAAERMTSGGVARSVVVFD